ncbi:TPR repeat-containing protein [Nostoc carneum NIES-2107]|nr:TPR repeat-containing protein [Nostoc carneum NIES-2107]
MKDETNRHSSCHQWCRQNQEKLIYKMFCYFRKYQKINNSASRGMISTEFRANRPLVTALYQLFMRLHRIRSPLAPLEKGGEAEKSLKVPLFKGDLGGSKYLQLHIKLVLPLKLFKYCFNGKSLQSFYNFRLSILITLTLLWGSSIYLSTSFAITPPDLLAQTTSQGAVDLLNQGLQAIQAGRVQDAIASFKKAVLLDPKLAPAHYNLGLALRQTGQLQPAADAFYQATQADPKFAPAFANLGGALLEGNNLQLANDYLQRAVELDSKLGFAHYNLGLLREQQRDWERAIAAFRKAMQYSQNAPEPAYHLGLVYLQQGKVDQAREAFRQALRVNPQYAEAHYNLGSIWFQQSKWQEALEAFRKAATANSNYANAYYGAGLAFMQLRQYAQAAQVFQYARDLYNAQGNPQWGKNAQQLLQQAQNFHYQPR